MHKNTLDILKNFSTINSGILIRKSNVLRTVSIEKNILAKAVVPDTFTQEFAIYNLNEFLSTYRLFDSPSLAYKTDHMILSDKDSTVKYNYSDPSVVVAAPEKDLEVVPLIEFDLSCDYLEKLIKASAVMQFNTLEISSKGLKAFDNKTSKGNDFQSKPSNITSKPEAKSYNISINLLKVIPTDYHVKVSDRVVKLTGKIDNVELTYDIAVNPS